MNSYVSKFRGKLLVEMTREELIAAVQALADFRDTSSFYVERPAPQVYQLPADINGRSVFVTVKIDTKATVP